MKKYIIVAIIILIALGLVSSIIIFKYGNKKEVTQDTFPYLLSEECEIISENANKGMVIKDKYENEWVWIEVPKNKVFLMSKDESDYENIEKDIKEYTKDYAKEEYEDYIEDEQYIKLKNKTLSSIYQYGGFWISRYEIGTEQERTSKENKMTEPMSKPELYVYNYVTFNQANKISSSISNGEYNSSLLFGFQCDLICKFIEENGYNKNNEKITKEMINGNSSSWGNYYSSSFKIDRGKYSEDNGKSYITVTDNTEKRNYKNLLLTTGASEQNKICNIYDFAGNVSEWILEYSKERKDLNIIRDGSFYFNYGGNDPTNQRYRIDPNSSSSSYGFRIMCIK